METRDSERLLLTVKYITHTVHTTSVCIEEIGMELPYACFFSLLCDSSMLLTVFPLLFSNVLVLCRIIYPVNCWRLLSWFLFGDLIGNGLGHCGCILVYVYTYLEMFFRNKIQGL